MISKNHSRKKKFSSASLLFLVATFSLCGFTKVNAQSSDSLKTKSDTIVETAKPIHSPRKALLFSAVLPGLGQAYNKKYWKIPIIYAGFAGIAYAIVFNQRYYSDYKNAYYNRANGLPDNYPLYTEDDLLTLDNYYHKYRDLSIICGGFLYILNLVDANVDAQFFTFDVSDNLTLQVQPYLNPVNFCKNTALAGFTINLKL